MILCFLLAILCIGYGILIRMAGSGTLFFAVWFGIAGLFIFSGIFIHWKLWQKLPVKQKTGCFGHKEKYGNLR